MSSELKRLTLEEVLDRLLELEKVVDRLLELETADARLRRAYGTSPLPVFRRTADSMVRQQVSEKIYTEVCAAWRMLTDVRFKLLGLLPLASLAGGYGLFTFNATTQTPAIWFLQISAIWSLRFTIALFGLVVTIGLIMYERRNDGLYDDLISRGRRIEEEWGVDTGLFRGRRAGRLVTHGLATWTIYWATLVLWVAVARLWCKRRDLVGYDIG